MLKQCLVDSHLLKSPRNMWQGRVDVKPAARDAAAQWGACNLSSHKSHFDISPEVPLM